MIAYYNNNNQVGGIQGTISSRPNPNLRWEKTTTLNVGIDFALLGNRLNGSIEYYNKKELTFLPIPMAYRLKDGDIAHIPSITEK